jgi:hypothetical protein
VCRRRRQQRCTGHRAPVIPTRWLRRRSAALSVCRTAEAAAGDGSSPGFMISPFNNMQVTTTISLIFRLTVVNLSSRGWRRPVGERGLQDRCTGVTCQHPTRGLRRGSVRPVPREFFSGIEDLVRSDFAKFSQLVWAQIFPARPEPAFSAQKSNFRSDIWFGARFTHINQCVYKQYCRCT